LSYIVTDDRADVKCKITVLLSDRWRSWWEADRRMEDWCRCWRRACPVTTWSALLEVSTT